MQKYRFEGTPASHDVNGANVRSSIGNGTSTATSDNSTDARTRPKIAESRAEHATDGNHRSWAPAVYICIGNGIRERIEGPKDALEVLDYRWPNIKGQEYIEAKRRCVDAMHGHVSTDFARDGFMDAVIAARLLSS